MDFFSASEIAHVQFVIEKMWEDDNKSLDVGVPCFQTHPTHPYYASYSHELDKSWYFWMWCLQWVYNGYIIWLDWVHSVGEIYTIRKNTVLFFYTYVGNLGYVHKSFGRMGISHWFFPRYFHHQHWESPYWSWNILGQDKWKWTQPCRTCASPTKV